MRTRSKYLWPAPTKRRKTCVDPQTFQRVLKRPSIQQVPAQPIRNQLCQFLPLGHAERTYQLTLACWLCSVPVIVCLTCSRIGANKCVPLIAPEGNNVVILVVLTNLDSICRCTRVTTGIFC